MKSQRFVHYISAFVLGVTAIASEAKEVTLNHKGFMLNANLELAENKQLADGAILITHGGLAHHGMELIVYLQRLLREYGHNSLAINLSLGLNNRKGMYNCNVTHRHRHDDAHDEIGAWLGWLKKQGADRVTLLGHSRGGLQTALYAAERDHVQLKAVILMAPATRDNGGAGYQQRYKNPLSPLLEKAQILIKQGKGDTVLEHANLMFCRDTSVTADAFVSYYGPDPRLDTPYLLDKLNKPTLVIIAGNDEIVIGLDKKMRPLANSKYVHTQVIDGADHFFRDLNADDAVEAIDVFLKKVVDLK